MIANALESLPNVSQVRTHHTLKGTLIEEYGANSVVFSCFFAQPKSLGMTSYNKFWTLSTEELYNDERNMAIVYNMQERMNSYFENVSTNTEIIFNGVAATLNVANVAFTPL
jgi:hypothetical protein